MNAKAAAKPEAMAAAISEFLEAAGVALDHPDFRGTPQRVASAWQEFFLSGYNADVAQILGDPVVGEGPVEMVCIRDLPCHGMCPHHLLPWTGTATITYLPHRKLAGFGRIDQVLQSYSRRLTLQERVCNEVVGAIMSGLEARAASCEIDATHACLCLPGDKHATRVVARASRGDFSGLQPARSQ
jgi:GTP cyclohydrolase I